MKKRHLFIAIEGIDGVGKTTIANLLVKKLDAIYQKTPPSNLKWVARLLDKFHNPEIEAIGYFLLTIYTSLFFIARLLKQRVTVCDKYILTTIVAQTCLGGKLIKIIERIRYKFIQKPDYTFCLTICNDNELMRRLRKRGRLDENDKQLLPYRFEMQNEYKRLPEVITIDTACRTPEQVLNLVLDYLKT